MAIYKDPRVVLVVLMTKRQKLSVPQRQSSAESSNDCTQSSHLDRKSEGFTHTAHGLSAFIFRSMKVLMET